MKVTEKPSIDKRAERIGLITGISDEIYFCSISRISTVYLERLNKYEWMAWRETYLPNSDKLKSHRLIARGGIRYVLSEAKKYIKYVTR